MRSVIAITIVLGVAVAAKAQVAPEATSGPVIPLSGNLSYAARYSQTIQSFPGGVNGQNAMVTGDFSYTSANERTPFTVTIGAGDSWVISGTSYNNGPFENLAISQGLAGARWSIHLGDTVNYLTGAPVEGFAGVPGTGEPISEPTPPSDETIQTVNATVINNAANFGYSYKVSAFSTVNANVGYSLIRYPNDNGIESDDLSVTASWAQRLNARSTVTGSYAYSHFNYIDADLGFNVNTPTFQWQYTLNPKVSWKISGGPQFLNPSGSNASESSGSGSGGTGAVPEDEEHSSIGASIAASISYETRWGGASVTYNRGIDSGGGYLYGGKSDSLVGTFDHQFGHRVESQLSVALSAGYRNTSSVFDTADSGGSGSPILDGISGDIVSEYGAVQATRALGRNFSANASFTATEQGYPAQNSNNPATGYALNGLWRVISFGIGYTPQPIHLRH